MPDHILLLLTPTETLERTMQLIKGGFSHRMASTVPTCQRSLNSIGGEATFTTLAKPDSPNVHQQRLSPNIFHRTTIPVSRPPRRIYTKTHENDILRSDGASNLSRTEHQADSSLR